MPKFRSYILSGLPFFSGGSFFSGMAVCGVDEGKVEFKRGAVI